MKPIVFPGVNTVLAESQPQYNPLPMIRTEDGECISCWEFSKEELEEINRTGRMYIKQMTFNQGFNPIYPSVDLSNGYEIRRNGDKS